MQAMPIRIFLVLFLLVLIYPSSLVAATEQRVALVIGNGAYGSGPLKNPVNDATDMAATLKRMGFSVILKTNARFKDMDSAIREFGRRLSRSEVGLFYFAGHGIQVGGVNYLIPTGANVEKEEDVRYEAVDAGRVLAEMSHANNGLNIVILDSCRNNPFARSFRSETRGLAVIGHVPKGAFISYATSPGDVARDGDGRNSPYTKALMQHMKKPGLPIETVFKKVRQTLDSETGGKQIPWESSSLKGDFFFVPGASGSKGGVVRDEAAETTSAATDNLDDESRKLEAEQRRLEEERSSFVKKKALEEKRQKIAEERERLAAEQEAERQAAKERKQAKKSTTIAMAKRPSQPTVSEIGRDGRFIAYDNETVLDTRTNLMWAAKDNGGNIDWANAKSYCKSYQGGGYTDWRMPTRDELSGLHEPNKKTRLGFQLTELIDLSSCFQWTSDVQGLDNYYGFSGVDLYWMQMSTARGKRALPVRSAK